ncbi:RNA dependent RNA polymerase-domain-containing protein [Amylocarpus encephaloides]|uniref:RNA-dependent RNA polymerase n=1 Tax=Amylocarpus encephaloides TaxID=45428 RepID=A0A9P7YIB6_9HELO|nr:RNA dependent RNA polymerase-domain-containing protein [Amylocarpus encephaloides]
MVPRAEPTVTDQKSNTLTKGASDQVKESIRVEVRLVVEDLTRVWDLRLQMPPDNQSPSKREKLKASEDQCVAMIKALTYKKLQFEPLRAFQQRAGELWSGWVLKPKAERGIVPDVGRNNVHPVTDGERKQLLALLLEILEPPYRDFCKKNQQRVFTRTLSNQIPSDGVNDSPVPFPLASTKPDPNKRPREEHIVDAPALQTMKKPKSDFMPVPTSRMTNEMLSNIRGRPLAPESHVWRSANTSFESAAQSSIFSASNPSFGQADPVNTQETIPDLIDLDFDDSTQPVGTQAVSLFNAKAMAVNARETETDMFETKLSSDYGAGSSFEAEIKAAADSNGLFFGTEMTTKRIDDSLSQDLMEFGLYSLTNDIAKLPDSLSSAPLQIIYEITRVFAFTGVAMSDAIFPDMSSNYANYNELWSFLQSMPELRGKVFPPKSEKAAWEAANRDFASNLSGVILGGSLTYNLSSGTGPLFDFRLKPMTLDKRHRLSRRYGDDRFFEMDMPHLKGDNLPKPIQGDLGHTALLKWLVDGPHWLFGRSWKPFHCKSKERKEKKEKKKDKKLVKKETETAHCLYFFAVRGNGISPAYERQDQKNSMEIHELLDNVRLTRQNKHQSFLKLFSRTSLAVSRNTPTVTLPRSQIHYRSDIELNDEVMTDGAGRMSPAMAQEVTRVLGLSYPASGFQGRIGEAKGFWSVDHSDRTRELWIEVCPSQCKWVRSKNKDDDYFDHGPHNRTLEVLKPSGPLKSADLNLQFLPLLINRAKNPDAMKSSLRSLLEEGLSTELETLRASMDDPASLRKWIQENYPNTSERLRRGEIFYEGGMPVFTDEKLIMMLDAGFDIRKLKYAADLCKQLFKTKCDELKDRLNITIGKSTYAYMVPDFAGVLEPNEIYMDFSSFIDNASGLSGVLLHGQDILVARSPAHFVSDIQKVKAVAKVELIGLKDVIVFPTKGNPSLAAKLSGGDYDGDLAWVCWEPSIVDNFVTADVPEMPDLVAEGFIRKDSTKYESLTADLVAPSERVSHFLQKSFSFNMQPNLLGICTSWKETFCYNDRSVATPEATKISALLSSLVDQAKQGYTFDDSDWGRFKKSLARVNKVHMFKPEYKNVNPNLTKKADHVVDYLMYIAKIKVDSSLEEFENTLPKNIPRWDDDLAACSQWGQTESLTFKEWRSLLSDLNQDLEALTESWSAAWITNKQREDTPEFAPILLSHYEKYQAIQPHTKTILSHSLVASYANPDLSQWPLLKASVLFASYRNKTSKFPWYMAGRQLVHMKANKKGVANASHSVIPSMYICYKPNNSLIKQLSGIGNYLVDSVGVGNVDEIEETQQDC